MSQKVLVIGATGAMGKYLVPELAKKGFTVDGISLDDVKSEFPNVTYFQTNAKDRNVLDSFLDRHYDAIVDFMTYSSKEADEFLPYVTEKTGQYFFLSSCRVFNNLEVPIRESSPRLLDSSDDPKLLASDDYCIYKAKGENKLRSLSNRNWTIVRPSTTYSYLRYQLVTLEAENTVGRAFAGKKVVVPEQARLIPATLCWGGDVAKMFAGLVFNPKALGNDFNVTTNEAHTWDEIAGYYKDICGLEAVWVDKEDYLHILDPDVDNHPWRRWQLEYARMFNRVYDNTKVLETAGLKQSDFISLYDGLKREITRCPKDYPFKSLQSMDEYLQAKGI